MRTIKIKDKELNIKFSNRSLYDFCEVNGSLDFLEINAIKGNKIKITYELLWAGIKNVNSGISKEQLFELIDDIPLDDIYIELMKELEKVGFIKSSSTSTKDSERTLTKEEMEIAKSILF